MKKFETTVLNIKHNAYDDQQEGEEEDGQQPQPLQWHDIIEVCQLHIFSYLCIHDLMKTCQLVDKRIYKLLLQENEFWVEVLLRNLKGVGNVYRVKEYYQPAIRRTTRSQIEGSPLTKSQSSLSSMGKGKKREERNHEERDEIVEEQQSFRYGDDEEEDDDDGPFESDNESNDDDDFYEQLRRSVEERLSRSSSTSASSPSPSPPSSATLSPSLKERFTQDLPFIQTIENARSLLRDIVQIIPIGKYLQLNTDVVEVSSMDRTVENPLNTLKKSPCLEQIQEYRIKSPHLPEPMINRLGYLLQVQRCSCTGNGISCYWSSAPNPDKSLTQFITYSFGTRNQLSVIYGFSLTAYQAFFHPNAPIYAPMKARLQILSPNHSKHFDSFPRKKNAVMDNTNQHYRHPRTTTTTGTGGSTGASSGTASTDMDFSLFEESIAYESKVFDIAHTSQPQYFPLDDQPVLCMGGYVRLIVQGAHQRQNLAEWGVEANADDYYICLSNVEIFGLSLREYEFQLMNVQKMDVLLPTVVDSMEQKDSKDAMLCGKCSSSTDDVTINDLKEEVKEKTVSIWKLAKKRDHDDGSNNRSRTSSYEEPVVSVKRSPPPTATSSSSTSATAGDMSYEDVQDQFVNFHFSPSRGNGFRWPKFKDLS